MVVAEPPKIFLRTGRVDGMFKLLVHCGIAVEKNNLSILLLVHVQGNRMQLETTRLQIEAL